MTLRIADGYEQYGTSIANLPRFYVANGGWTQMVTGRDGGTGKAVRLYASIGVDGYLTVPMDNLSEFYTGVAYYCEEINQNLNDAEWWQFRDNTTIHLSLTLTADGQLQVYRGPVYSNLLATSGAKRLRQDIWYYIECHFQIADSTTVECQVRVNEEVWITIPLGTDTRNGANAYCTNMQFNANGSQTGFYIDDLYLCDTTGPYNTSFLGDMRVVPAFPNGNGDYSDFIGKDGDSTDNYLQVDETTPDLDTSYVQSSTLNQKDNYNFDDLVVTPIEIFGAVVYVLATKTDSGSRIGRHLYTSAAGTDVEGSDFYASQGAWQYFTQVWERHPVNKFEWTETTINAFKAGYKVSG